ncbi:pilus assembly protein [Thiocystis minor]|uniref:type IV pilin protein n=1 Tax=Thiocystis minor TaxID=61597 RepID=UPI0019146849|nr:type IV pilin protein [Thiocystis minor]MBK5965685.1 pilus assembly protein [Thiocystis minor]
MKIRFVTDHHGFTLVELMIAVSIVTILSAIALPSYQKEIRRSRRSDGQIALMAIAIAQEKMRSNCTQYAVTLSGVTHCDTDGPSSALGISATSPEGYYRLSISGASATGFIASAVPIGHQAKDAAGGVSCDPLTIDQDSNREPEACW